MAIDDARNGSKPSPAFQLLHVEGFLEVARRGSVSRAAEALFITQPTLTARLHALENELGVKLFLRTPRGMRLT
jgi:DNA-binding transcriptional LysR family regulator